MPAGMIDIWVCDTQKAFQASVHAPIQDWAVGCAFPLSRRICYPKSENTSHLRNCSWHRYSVTRSHMSFSDNVPAKPLKKSHYGFIEGIAIYFADEWVPSRHETLLKHIFLEIYFCHFKNWREVFRVRKPARIWRMLKVKTHSVG